MLTRTSEQERAQQNATAAASLRLIGFDPHDKHHARLHAAV
jgi:hypothetical protein